MVTTIPEKPMDISDISQRLSWLDEERRRDHGEIARLAQEMASALTILKEQAGRERSADERLAVVESTLKQLPHLDDAITAARSGLAPLHDADIRLEDEITRQGKDLRSHADQSARLLSEINGRLDAVAKNSDGLLQRLHALETQRKDETSRAGALAARLDALVKVTDGLAERLSLLDSGRKDQASRVADTMTRLDAATRTADSLAERLNRLETQCKDQTSRAADTMMRLDAATKDAHGMAERLNLLDTQRKEQVNRAGEMSLRLDAVIKAAAGLEDRLQLLDAQRKNAAAQSAETTTRLAALGAAADALATRVQVVEARVVDSDQRVNAMFTQIARLEAGQAQSLEEVKRSVARAESLVSDMHGVRREIMLAREEDAKQRNDDVASISEMKDALATLERQIEEIVESNKPVLVRLERLEETPNQLAAATQRLALAEEHLEVLQATYKGLQEVEDRHWNTDIPLVLQAVEESSAACANNAVNIEELMAAAQGLKEALREVQINVQNEHTFSEDLAASLRGLIEEDLQARLAGTQKQLVALRRLANAPVEHEEGA